MIGRRMLVALAALAGAGGCGSDPAPGPASKTYTLRGVVRKVDAASGEVTIKHEALPGFMPAMTMPFTLKDRSKLEDVRPGDEVEGPLKVEFSGSEVKDYDLADLTVTRPAPEAATPAPPSPAEATLKAGDPVPDFTVTTQEGKTLRLSELKGDVVVLTFIYTRCPLPDFCPAVNAKFATLARRLSTVKGRGDRVRLLSVSFDPGHDTPQVLEEHAARVGAGPPLWTFAVATDDELARVSGPLGLVAVPGSREISHNLRTALIDPEGRLARLELGGGWKPSDLLAEILRLTPPAPKGSGAGPVGP